MPEIAERMLELARDALAEQERHVAELRTRGAAVLGAGGVIGGLLGKEVFAGVHPNGWLEWSCAVLGIAAAITLIGCTVALFSLRTLAFSMDARKTYAWLFNHQVISQPLVDLELADRLVATREENANAVETLRRSLLGAIAALVVLSAGFAVAAALAS